MGVRKAKHGLPLTIFFTILSILYVYPIVLVIINSFKKKAYISRVPFEIPIDNMFVGLVSSSCCKSSARTPRP